MRIFLGRTQDVEALKYYPLFFGKYEKEKKSTSSGSSGGGRNSSVTISTQKEEIYESKDFASLEPGEFIGMGNRSNIKGHFRKKFRLFELEEEPLPVVAFRTEKEISDNYTRILKDIERVLGMEDAEVDVNSLFYNPQIQISAESETKRSIFREKDKTKRSKKESAQHSKSRNKSFVMTSVSAL